MLTTVEKVLFLKSIGIFSGLPGEDLAPIARIAEEVDFHAGEEVFREGDPGDSLYLVVHGKARVHRGRREIALLGEKECFGEMALLDGEARSASVAAAEDLQTLRISRDDFFDILGDRVEIAQGIFKVLTGRLRTAIR